MEKNSNQGKDEETAMQKKRKNEPCSMYDLLWFSPLLVVQSSSNLTSIQVQRPNKRANCQVWKERGEGECTKPHEC